MLSLKNFALSCLFCPTLLCLLVVGVALTSKSTAAQSDDGQTLRTLLGEVRQLRLALQRSTLNAYRTQIGIEQAQFQQGRVDALARDLDGVRMQLTTQKVSRAQLEERSKEMQNELNLEGEPYRRSQLERQLKDAKRNLEMQSQWEERNRERETQLSAKLQAEQLKLGELNDRLGALERELEAQPSNEKPR